MRCMKQNSFFLSTFPSVYLDFNKCSDKSVEVKPPALLGNYDIPTDRPTDRPTNGHEGEGKVTLFPFMER